MLLVANDNDNNWQWTNGEVTESQTVNTATDNKELYDTQKDKF